MAKDYEIKNYFSTITNNFTDFSNVNEDMYYWEYSVPIDGKSYTCMRHENEVIIFYGIIQESLFNHIEPLIKFEL